MPGFIAFTSRSENFRINGSNITGPGALASEILPNLPPETARGFDLGIKSNWRDNTLSGSFTNYTLENNNQRRTDRLRSDTDPRNLDATTANNITWFNVGGRERNTGIELDGIASFRFSGAAQTNRVGGQVPECAIRWIDDARFAGVGRCGDHRARCRCDLRADA